MKLLSMTRNCNKIDKKKSLWTIWKTVMDLLNLSYLQLKFSITKIFLQMFKSCTSMRSCSQTRPGICSQTRLGISLCSLSGLSLQGRGQFFVLLGQSEQDLSLLLLWTDSAREASLPGQLISHFTIPFCYSCFSVKSCSQDVREMWRVERLV